MVYKLGSSKNFTGGECSKIGVSISSLVKNVAALYLFG